MYYPVSKKGVTEFSGVLNVSEQHYYFKEQEYFCLMWENPHAEPVSLGFEYKVKEK
ncbi:MAG: hypothetical protein HZC11_03005 [Nitrospirae bacterium]|nr:hypothetical protein [Nitrospirota bacterium]